jgi:hypothetical protein
MRALALLALMLASTASAQSADQRPAGQRPAANPHRGGALPSEREGAEPVIGRDARDLQRLFGDPRLDIHEGPAHKLQYANDRCILDAYLYPPREGAEAVVTHVDTRTPDGEATDRAECIRALRRR